jgi:putative FmdB family regulatory protein
MPLFEYVCEKCSATFTLLQKAEVRPGETVCPKCGAQHVQKIFSTFASKIAGRAEPSGGGHSCPPAGCGCC